MQMRSCDLIKGNKHLITCWVTLLYYKAKYNDSHSMMDTYMITYNNYKQLGLMLYVIQNVNHRDASEGVTHNDDALCFKKIILL